MMPLFGNGGGLLLGMILLAIVVLAITYRPRRRPPVARCGCPACKPRVIQ